MQKIPCQSPIFVQQDGNEPIPAAPLLSPSPNQDQASPPPSRPPSPLCLRSPRNPLHTRSPGDQQISDILKFPKLSHLLLFWEIIILNFKNSVFSFHQAKLCVIYVNNITKIIALERSASLKTSQ